MEACETGNVGVVQLALEGGADPNQANEVSYSYLPCYKVAWGESYIGGNALRPGHNYSTLLQRPMRMQ